MENSGFQNIYNNTYETKYSKFEGISIRRKALVVGGKQLDVATSTKHVFKTVPNCFVKTRNTRDPPLTHFCLPFQHLLSERLTSPGIMGEPRVPPLNPSETIVLSEHYRL